MRCDYMLPSSNTTPKSFNPRTYMRCDAIDNGILGHMGVSIHAPT